ncbi:hypothetical protein PRBEI_2000399000 [Prionailurus iriomotensis]
MVFFTGLKTTRPSEDPTGPGEATGAVDSLVPHSTLRQDGGSKISRVSFYKGTNSIVNEAFTTGILGENIESIA